MSNNNKQSILLVILIGLPCSGKTTLCNSILQYINNNNANVKHNILIHHVSVDNVYNDIYNQQQLVDTKLNTVELWHKARYIAEQQCINAITDNDIVKPTIILLDDNNVYYSESKRYINIADSNYIHYIQLYCCVTLDIAKQRYTDRQHDNDSIAHQHLSTDTIEKMHDLLLQRSNDLHIATDNTITLSCNNLSNVNIEQLCNTLINKLNLPLPTINRYDIQKQQSDRLYISQQQTLNNIKHQSDIVLRKLVQQCVLKCDNNIDKKQYANNLNNIRIELLNNIKQQKVDMNLFDAKRDEHLCKLFNDMLQQHNTTQ